METRQYSKAKEMSLLVAILLIPLTVVRLKVLTVVVILIQKNR